MGYTHYFQQHRSFTKAQWTEVCADLGAILKYAQHDGGVSLANGSGDPGTSPEVTSDSIFFNGVGDDSHETFAIYRIRQPVQKWQTQKQRGWDFTKTERKPYDPVVVACLCYLTTVTRQENPTSHEPIIGSEIFTASSDGHGGDWISGLDLARKALPAKANTVDIPMDIMKSDRWCAPWVHNETKSFEVHFCVDGFGYVSCGDDSYCFESHAALGQFLEKTKKAAFSSGGNTSFGRYSYVEDNIWNATGCFDEARHKRIAKAQSRVLGSLFPVDPSCAKQPPAFVRPGQMPANAGRDFCYNVSDLLSLGEKA